VSDARAAVTARALCLGALLSLCVVLLQLYNDFYLENTLLLGNHLPAAGTTLLLFLAGAVNPLLRRARPAWALSSGELLLVWAMLGVAGGIAGSGFLRCLPGWLAAPGYLTTPANEWAEWILKPLPRWLLVGRDPDAPAIRWYMEGLPRGRTIPWGAWLGPLAGWSAFALCLFGAALAACAVLYRPWSGAERLVFPLVALPAAIVAAPAPGRRLNAFLGNWAVWAGAAIPVLIHGVNGLRAFYPRLPAVPLTFGASGFFPDRPWSEFDLGEARVFFSMIGVAFLLTTETSFSLWVFYVLFKLSYVLVAWTGAGESGFFGSWYDRVAVCETAGAVFVVTGFILWIARAHLGAWLRRAAAARADPDLDIVPPRWALVMFAGGMAGTVAWLAAAGVSWWAAALGMLLFLCVLLVVTRIVAEAGLLFVGNRSPASDFLMNLFPAGWLTGPTVTVFLMLKGVMMRDLKEVLMPFFMNGIRAGAVGRLRLRPVALALGLTALGGLGVGAYARISTAYKYGGVNGDEWANLVAPREFLGNLATWRKSPRPLDRLALGDLRTLPVGVAHVGMGAGIAALLLLARARFLWWPLSPYGLIMCATYQMDMSWFSLFLGWLAKAGVMRFGGATGYRKLLPFFLGLVLGESLMASVWTLSSLLTGSPGIYLLPD